jgi:hypothetical protein
MDQYSREEQTSGQTYVTSSGGTALSGNMTLRWIAWYSNVRIDVQATRLTFVSSQPGLLCSTLLFDKATGQRGHSCL